MSKAKDITINTAKKSAAGTLLPWAAAGVAGYLLYKALDKSNIFSGLTESAGSAVDTILQGAVETVTQPVTKFIEGGKELVETTKEIIVEVPNKGVEKFQTFSSAKEGDLKGGIKTGITLANPFMTPAGKVKAGGTYANKVTNIFESITPTVSVSDLFKTGIGVANPFTTPAGKTKVLAESTKKVISTPTTNAAQSPLSKGSMNVNTIISKGLSTTKSKGTGKAKVISASESSLSSKASDPKSIVKKGLRSKK